ncbi:hypothetical protein BT63DRAFT_443055 [Microthyrium microscopicum]|uniref:SAP domain-containing protein n=1 Tax=Microthyrium microscopicum TaxID=703497 RepID=A0A6A6U428_9PEZI|nr:hypothetical protein BT63DRAFT_443055 [Microthyrium microscopicum]
MSSHVQRSYTPPEAYPSDMLKNQGASNHGDEPDSDDSQATILTPAPKRNIPSSLVRQWEQSPQAIAGASNAMSSPYAHPPNPNQGPPPYSHMPSGYHFASPSHTHAPYSHTRNYSGAQHYANRTHDIPLRSSPAANTPPLAAPAHTANAVPLVTPVTPRRNDLASTNPFTPNTGDSTAATGTGKAKRTVKDSSGRKNNAAPRPISHIRDDIDQTIWIMKHAGEKNEVVRDVVNPMLPPNAKPYSAKTIGTRFLRLCQKQREWDARLEDPAPFVFTAEMDQYLQDEAVPTVNLQNAEKMARLKEARNQKIADMMNAQFGDDKKLKAADVKQRLEDLQAGRTSDDSQGDDVVETAEERQARVLQEEATRAANHAAAKKAHQEKELEKAKKKEDKARRLAAQIAKLEKTVDKKTGMLTDLHAKAAKLVGPQSSSAQPATSPSQDALFSPVNGQMTRSGNSGDEMDEEAGEIVAPETPCPKSKKTSSFYSTKRTYGLAKGDDPRSKLKQYEITKLCQSRNLVSTGQKAAICKRLADSDAAMSIEELQTMMEKRSLEVDGSKDELIARLVQYDLANSEWGKMLSTVTPEELDSPLENLPHGMGNLMQPSPASVKRARTPEDEYEDGITSPTKRGRSDLTPAGPVRKIDFSMLGRDSLQK